jgi:peptidoglycan/LPS O-acetylase OafA/YrhL
MTEHRALVTRVVGQPHTGRFASLEGYRGVAALLVVVYHVRPSLVQRSGNARADIVDNFGNFGVAVFFLLSGFLLFRPMSDAMLRRERPSPVGRFLLRRALRIYPGYWVALVGWAALATAEARNVTSPLKSFFLLSTDLRGLGVAWTLAIEVRFYVFLAVVAAVGPWLAARCRSARNVMRWQVGFLVAMYVTAVTFRIVIVHIHDGLFLYAGSMVNYLDWFAWGMTLALLVAWRDNGGTVWRPLAQLASREWACLLCSAVCFLAVVKVMGNPLSLSVSETNPAYFFRFAMQAPAGFFLLLPAVLGDQGQPVQRFLRSAWPAAVGTVSYGLYLWHKTIIEALDKHLPKGGTWYGFIGGLAVVLAISLTLATLSYRLLERPALRLAEPAPRRRRELLEATTG